MIFGVPGPAGEGTADPAAAALRGPALSVRRLSHPVKQRGLCPAHLHLARGGRAAILFG